MKITAQIVNSEVDVEIDLALVLDQMLDECSSDTVNSSMHGISRVHTFLTRISEQLIAEFKPSNRKIVHDFLSAQAQRWAEK